MNEGFIKLDRKLLKWEWKDDPYMVALWVEILLQANYQERKWHGKVFEPGSFPTSIKKLSQATGMSEKRVRTCLNRLESTNEIVTERAHYGTKIYVVKWALFQGLDDDDGQAKGTRRANKGQTRGNTLRNKEGKKERNIYNTVPVYDPSTNRKMSDEEEAELLEIMGRA